MGTKVQSKTYFPGSVRDLNVGLCNGNGVWELYHDDRASASRNTPYFDSFPKSQPAGGYAKERIRQTILKQESIFKNQLQELHRLYKRQRDLMNEVTRRDQRVENVHNLSAKRAYFLADLNEPVSTEETSFSTSFANSNSKPANSESGFCFSSKFLQTGQLNCNFADGRINEWLNAERRKALERLSSFPGPRRTLFGVEIQHPSTQIPDYLMDNKHVNGSGSRLASSSRGTVGHHNLNELRPTENDAQKDRRTPDGKLPPWLNVKPGSCSERVKRNETTVYQMNLDSLQNRSQQFFKKAETTRDSDQREFKKVKTDDDLRTATKILGVPIVENHREMTDLPLESCKKLNSRILGVPIVDRREMTDLPLESRKKSNSRPHIDLNLSLTEEEAPPSTPSLPEAILEPETDSREIKLDEPANLTLEVNSEDTLSDLFTVAAKAIVSISSSNLPVAHNRCQPSDEPPDDTLLLWLADAITAHDDSIKVDKDCIVDDFEYMTLKLEDSKDEYSCYMPTVVEAEKEKAAGLPPKRAARKGRGRLRLRRDFQRDILPSIVSLARREVLEDVQAFEDILAATGVSWQSSLSKRKAAGKNGRNRRHVVVPPPPPPAVEQNICCLGGWGKRTRRMPRQRCQNGGNHRSLALKC